MATSLLNSVIHCKRRRGGNEPGQGDLFKLLSIISTFAAIILSYLSKRCGGREGGKGEGEGGKGGRGGCEPSQGECNFFKLLSKRVFAPVIL